MDKIISASEYEARNIKKVLSVPEDKIRVIPHGVDDIIYPSFKQEKTDDESVIKLLYVGLLIGVERRCSSMV